MDIARELINTRRTHLQNYPIDFKDRADNRIDFLFYHYSEYLPLSTMKTRGIMVFPKHFCNLSFEQCRVSFDHFYNLHGNCHFANLMSLHPVWVHYPK